MDEINRQELVRLQLERAERFIEQADRMLEEQCYDLAANRFYYACFHAIQGLFINDGFSSHTHKGLHQILGLNYVRTGLFDIRLSSFLRTMEQLREKADYNCVYDITEEEAKEMQLPSHEIIESVKLLINSEKP